MPDEEKLTTAQAIVITPDDAVGDWLGPGDISVLTQGPVQEPGQHLWVLCTVHLVDMEAVKTGGPHMMTGANLVALSPVACFWCEQTHQPGMEDTVCPDDPGRV